jgi:hypothetical protein
MMAPPGADNARTTRGHPVRGGVVQDRRARGRPWRRPAARRPHDGGAVTVEAALALSSLALVTALAVGAIAAAVASVRCDDAARELVRLAARGEPDRGREVARRLAPTGAEITLTIRGDEATAEVTAAPLRLLPIRTAGRAVAVLEPAASTELGSTGSASTGSASTGSASTGSGSTGFPEPAGVPP